MIRPARFTTLCRRRPVPRARLRLAQLQPQASQAAGIAIKSGDTRRDDGSVFNMLPPNDTPPSNPLTDLDPDKEPPAPERSRKRRKAKSPGGTDIGSDVLDEAADDVDAERSTPSSSDSPYAGPNSAPIVEEDDPSSMAVSRVPMPFPLVTPTKRSRQPFDTHRFVSRLEGATVAPDVSKTLMEGVRSLISKRVDRATGNMLSKEELDNEAYLFKAALSKLRTESNVQNKNAGIAGRNALSAIRRELDSVETRIAQDVQVLKHDIELDMNNRKTDHSSDMKLASMSIEEINNRATISIGDLKTEIESAKWEATRRAITIIVVFVVFGVGMSTLTFGGTPEAHTDPPMVEPLPPTPPAPPPAQTRDIGVGPEEDPFDYEARIDKLLSSVERPERKERPRRPSKPPDVFVDRI